ncbi:MAG TPA: DNA repair protein RecN [Chitinophagaceae bacterium]
MLQKLVVQNYAIIDKVEINFSGHFNIITGETGAGKSILLGALSLILGERADLNVLFQKDRKCIIEGFFLLPDKQEVKDFFKEHELDHDPLTVIRREISAAGKSRAFINDTPVNLLQLAALGNMLVDLHRQFDTLELGKSDFQLEVIDALANHAEPLQAYGQIFHRLVQEQKELEALKQQNERANKELDYHKFLFEELQEAGFSENEIEEIDAELKVLSHAEEIRNTLGSINFQLQEGEEPLVQHLQQLQSSLQSVAGFHQALPEIAKRLQAACIELQDITGELEHINDQVQYDAERIAFINDRIALGYKLFKKHGVRSTGELLRIQVELGQKLNHAVHLEEEIASAEKEVESLLQQAGASAAVLSAGRKKQLLPFEKKVNELLTQVGMPGARLRVEMQSTGLHAAGQDKIEFLFDANKSNNFAAIRKVASGGELSRLMLCIKSLVATSVALPTLIFDEIDTGISGEAARQVGVIMKGLAESYQVVCITHQPQIAGRADAHYFVYKETKGQKLITNIRLLSQEERIITIAQMLSGEKPTAAAIENAREMVNG